MARRFRVDDLLGRVRQVADCEGDDHITDTFLKTQLSTIYGQAWGVVVETGLRYFETRTSLISDGSNVLSEPANIFCHVGLDYIEAGTSRRRPVTEMMAQERTWVDQPWITGTFARFFETVDDQILLYPTPPTGQTYQLLYIPQAPDLTSADDAELVDVVTPDGEAFITYGIAALVLARKDQEASLMQQEREAAKKRLSEWAGMRAFHQPRRQVVEDDWEDWNPGGWRWSPP